MLVQLNLWKPGFAGKTSFRFFIVTIIKNNKYVFSLFDEISIGFY